MPRRPRLLLLAPLLLAACAGGRTSLREALERTDLQARLAVRAGTMLGQGREAFVVGEERFNPDCIGFVEAVYQAEGIPLRRLLQKAAPTQDSGVAAAWEAVHQLGERWYGVDWPAPGDLVFFDNTWDRNGNGLVDDPLTHVGLVEWVHEDGTVRFLHRAGKGVERGTLNLASPHTARDADGRPLNAFLRATKGPTARDAPKLAGELFAGFGRIDLTAAATPR